MLDIHIVNAQGQVTGVIRNTVDDSVYSTEAYREWYATYFPSSMEYPEFVKTYYALHLARLAGDASVKRSLLRTPVYSNGKAYYAEDRNVLTGIVQSCNICKRCPNGEVTPPVTDPCALGLYELRIGGQSNDIANFNAASVTITWDSYDGSEAIQPFVIPVSGGWRDTLLSLGSLPMHPQTVSTPELYMNFTPDDTDPEYRVMVITLTPQYDGSYIGGTFTLTLNPADVNESLPSHGVGGIPVLPVVASPDFQHLTFSLCGYRPALE